jgi:hypothetical protein
MGNNADEAYKNPAMRTLRIVTAGIGRIGQAVASNRKRGYIFGCDRLDPAGLITHRAIPSLGRWE